MLSKGEILAIGETYGYRELSNNNNPNSIVLYKSNERLIFPYHVEIFPRTGDVVAYLPHPRQRSYRVWNYGAAENVESLKHVLEEPWSSYGIFADILAKPSLSIPRSYVFRDLASSYDEQIVTIDAEVRALLNDRKMLVDAKRAVFGDELPPPTMSNESNINAFLTGTGTGTSQTMSPPVVMSGGSGALGHGPSYQGQGIHQSMVNNQGGYTQSYSTAAHPSHQQMQNVQPPSVPQTVPQTHSHHSQIQLAQPLQPSPTNSNGVPFQTQVNRADAVTPAYMDNTSFGRVVTRDGVMFPFFLSEPACSENHSTGNMMVFDLGSNQRHMLRTLENQSNRVKSITIGEGYVVVYDNGSFQYHNLPHLLTQKIEEYGPGMRIQYASISRHNYYIKFSNGKIEWCGLDAFGSALKHGIQESKLKVSRVAFSQDNGWMILWDNGSLEGALLPQSLVEALQASPYVENVDINTMPSEHSDIDGHNPSVSRGIEPLSAYITAENTRIKDISMGPHGEWFVLFDDHSVTADNLTDELFQRLAIVRKNRGRIRSLAFGVDHTYILKYYLSDNR